MQHSAPLPEYSTTGKAWGLWLLTNVLGISSFIAMNLCHDPLHIDFWGVAIIGALVGGSALVGSVATVPVIIPAFRKLLIIPERNQRLMAAGLAISAIFGAIAFLLFVMTGTLAAIALYAGAWLYWPAALLATAWVYRDRLFAPDESDSGDNGAQR